MKFRHNFVNDVTEKLCNHIFRDLRDERYSIKKCVKCHRLFEDLEY